MEYARGSKYKKLEFKKKERDNQFTTKRSILGDQLWEQDGP